MARTQLPIEGLDALKAIIVDRERQDALAAVRAEAAVCRDCPLWETGTQTVFGAGPAAARLMLIGEAPGFHEDKQGIPFVGPAGRLLDQALEAAGIDRNHVFVTNTVKHRPWVPGGKMGKNRPPKQSEINACRQWLARELAIVRPPVVGCLGAVAARWIMGKDFKLTQQRGQWLESEYAPHVLATIHPAYVLIQPEESLDRVRDSFFEDVRMLGERWRLVASAQAA